MSYNHQAIEKKWQDRWDETGIFYAKDNDPREKFYCLVEFPYPSGAGLHIGHPRSYTALDVVSRKRRHQGKNVLYPIGWDAFGLPTENYAIKTGRKPQDITKENTDTFRRQLKSLGISFDWSREVNTTDPNYYKWTQWMFLEFFKAGLAYKTTQPINWCLSCKIGLANEEVVNGRCERCGGDTEKREKEQWMIAITKYADRLLEDLDTVDYMEKIKIQQRNWIGKSEGALISFKVDPSPGPVTPWINVFTTRPDTLFGTTYLVLAPEHELIEQIATDEQMLEIMAYVEAAKKKSEIERGSDEKEKTGVFTGAYAINPVTGKKIPVWVADYVLGGYGTGAIMAVPAHDERDFAFAKMFELPIVKVVEPEVLQNIIHPDVGISHGMQSDVKVVHECFTGEGVAVNSGEFTGQKTEEMKKNIVAWLETEGHGEASVNYKLRDWVFSRQRYWGEPIPLVHCDKECQVETKGWVPVPDDQLPVVLPEVEKYEPTDTGESPLATIEDWVNTTCPACGGSAKRETDTMPNWAGSSWYFLRYIDPHNNETFADQEKLNQWMPVDLYNGGMEHTTLHLLYSRFWNKFLFDRGHVPVSEPYARRHSHGLVLAEDGTKMSKSKGNVVNPDEIVSEYGADALRMYILFMGPFEEPVPWNLNGLIGVRRFLDKIMRYVSEWDESAAVDGGKIIEPHLKKASDDIDAFKFNTAVSTFMMLFNELGQKKITRDQLKRLLIVLCPFAPHVANEAWEMIGEEGLVEEQPWPEFDEALLVRDQVELGVQVNGKTRSAIVIAPDADEATAREAAFADENVKRHTEGKEIVKVIYVPGKIFNIVVK
ncbi:leucine--tRNA ligase [Candidatus Uhrbacteria bacterium CG_4_9_14_3_um_filter_50_9]|uniref:Leucine--tRNA ligase n=1 Tax=Candidatus Uhrbacteria bacterium CG_4_9_14_3_um_filter_50_9 TaxID=1975035 RepID=A0A2M7XEP6_9BACT|nr:MAG: leucine--tRNA ligase [Candidatus Uhrbacteria bacterium CG_4_9_14_3_um_filter_50_9]